MTQTKPSSGRTGGRDEKHYRLTLYVSGSSPRSVRAIGNIKRVCEEHLDGRYSLEVVDLYQQPERASGAQILATPTLIKSLPTPIRRLVGDLADVEKVLKGLGLRKLKDED